MATVWADLRPNPRFPHCAQVARRLLAEVWGCKPGDEIPPESDLLARAAEVAKDGDTADRMKAATALAMLDEIGGL